MAGDQTILNNTTTGSSRNSKEIEIPKLKSNVLDEYRRWKRDVDLWMELTKIEKNRQASHMILCGIQRAEIKDVVATIPKERRTTEEGMQFLLEVLDKYFMPNTFSRKIEVWANLVKTEKTESTTWTEFIRKMRKWRTDLLSLDLNFPEDLFCVALLYATKLDTKMKVQVEGMARAETTNNTLTQKAIEEVLLRFKTEDEIEETVNVVEDDETEESVYWVKNKTNWRNTRGNLRGRSNTRAMSTSTSRVKPPLRDW